MAGAAGRREKKVQVEYMKTVVLWSSPNVDGLTAAAKNSFISGLRACGVSDMEIDEIHLNRMKLNHCIACGNGFGNCKKDGVCVLKDDFEKIYEKLIEADGIVLVSAVYWHDMTECMKAFIDRLRRCETAHNHFLKGKRCFLIACAGGTGVGAIECLHQMEESIKHMGMRAYDRVPVIRFNQDYMIPALETAGKLYGQRISDGFDMQY